MYEEQEKRLEGASQLSDELAEEYREITRTYANAHADWLDKVWAHYREQTADVLGNQGPRSSNLGLIRAIRFGGEWIRATPPLFLRSVDGTVGAGPDLS